MYRRPTCYLTSLAALITVIVLTGCSTLSPYSRLTKLDLNLTASDQLNPDVNERPSPIVIKLFELKHPVSFEHADFFDLYERSKHTLASDGIASEELELRPGERVQLRLSVEEGSRYVGLIAAYRDLSYAQWRYTVALVPAAANRVDLTLEQDGIRKTSALHARGPTE